MLVRRQGAQVLRSEAYDQYAATRSIVEHVARQRSLRTFYKAALQYYQLLYGFNNGFRLIHDLNDVDVIR
jgi:hypothetical protein